MQHTDFVHNTRNMRRNVSNFALIILQVLTTSDAAYNLKTVKICPN